MPARPSGAPFAPSHDVAPMYDIPYSPTRPSHHGCPRTHPTLSTPSASSSRNGVQEPSEPPRPRVSCTTTA